MKVDFHNKKTIGLLVATLVLFAATISLLIFYLLNKSPTIEVIDFTDKTVEEIELWKQDNKLTDSQVVYEHQFDESIPIDSVISQSIEIGNKLGKDDILTIVLSNGPDPDLEVTIPDFAGQNETEILQWFTDNKFSDVTVEYVTSDTVKKDAFVKTNIQGTSAKRSDVILVSISVGNESIGIDIVMPDFKDYTKANIQAWAKTNNMSVTFKNETSNTIAAGSVISQNPTAGTTAKTGGKVTVTLSAGKGISVTSLVGKTKTDAANWIKSNGLKATYNDVYSTQAVGTVVAQKPNSGSVSQSSTISYDISVGLVPIENYTNKTRDSFNTYISSINAKNSKSANIKVNYTEVENSATPGTIISISVNGSNITKTVNVNPGTTINVTVSKAKTINVENKAGASEQDFINYVKNLGLNPSGTKRYNNSVASGIIVSNDTGNKAQGATVNYVVSMGKYSPSASSYSPGQSYTSLQNTINAANNQGAGWSVSKSDDYSDTIATGLIINCNVSGTSISCSVSKGPQPVPVNVPNYGGQPTSALVSFLNSKGLKGSSTSQYSDTVPAGLIISNDTGNKYAGETVNYVISNGPKPTPTPTPCGGGSTGTYPSCVCGSNQDYDQGSNSCVAKTTGTIPTNNLSSYNGSNYENAKGNVTSTLTGAGFTNLNFVKLTGDDNPDGRNGQVKSISPAPGTTNYSFNGQITIEIYSTD